MQHTAEDFSDIWKNVNGAKNRENMTPQDYSMPGGNEAFQNNLSLDTLQDLHEFTSEIVSTHSVTSEALGQPIESSSYQCGSFPSENEIIQQYSQDMGHPISQQATISSMNCNHHVGMQQMNGFLQSSPSNGDPSAPTHNSPFTPSPPQGFDFPTSPNDIPPVPPNTDYPGEYDFSINFGNKTESAPKSAQYTYSHSLNKLFVKMNVSCPIRFKCVVAPPAGCAVRAIPLFKRPEHAADVVTRCPNHKIPDEANYMHRSSHLIRADMPDDHVRYDTANDMRESVSVHYERPQIGAEFTTILYKFMCRSSCVGGINRRPLLVVFLLENQEGHVLGRRVVEIRICSCPGRDRSQEEKRKLLDCSASPSAGTDKCIKRSYKTVQTSSDLNRIALNKKKRTVVTNSQENQEEFVLKIRGRENFAILKQLKEALDLKEYVTLQQQEAYRKREEQEQTGLRQFKMEEPTSPKGFPKKNSSPY